MPAVAGKSYRLHGHMRPGLPGRAVKPSGVGVDVIRGIFSTKSVSTDESGAEIQRKVYWLVREQADGTFRVQPLSRNFVPTGEAKTVSREGFLDRFEPEPEFYLESVARKKREADDILGLEGPSDESGLPLAGLDLAAAQKANEENVRANFSLGLMLLSKDRAGKAQDVFERILRLSGPFDAEHKHLFNSMGIRLRKARLYDTALKFYERAVSLAPDDENIYHNMARALFEKGEMKMAMDRLRKSLDLNPELRESRRFVGYLRRRYLGAGKTRPHVYRKPFED